MAFPSTTMTGASPHTSLRPSPLASTKSLRRVLGLRAAGQTDSPSQTQQLPTGDEAAEAVSNLQPTVLVYTSAASALRAWVEPVAHLAQRVVVASREGQMPTALVDAFTEANVPTVHYHADLDLSSVQVMLFATNTDDNLELLRNTGSMSALLELDDSSLIRANRPLLRVYDELWVAGEAGADRYRTSGARVHESSYRFVGRPLAHAIERSSGPITQQSDDVATVLYAPESGHRFSANRDVGQPSEQTVRELLAASQASSRPVRIVLLEDPQVSADDAQYRAAVAKIAKTLADEAESSGVQHAVISGAQHAVISGAQHAVVGCDDLFDWFNQSSALISNSATIVHHYLASEKPFAVFGDLVDHPYARRATAVISEQGGAREVISVVTGDTPDTQLNDRAQLAAHWFGTPDQRSLDAFAVSVDALIGRAEVEIDQLTDKVRR